MFNKFFKNPVISSVLYCGLVILFAIFAAFYNVFKGDMTGFSAPLAIVLLSLSVVITLLPSVMLRLYSVMKLRLIKPQYENVIDAIFILVETSFMALTVLLYMQSMSGTPLAGLGLLLISVINVAVVLFWGIIAGIMHFWHTSTTGAEV